MSRIKIFRGLVTHKIQKISRNQGLFASKKMFRDGFRADATSKMERFAIIVNGFHPLTIITKHSILDVAAALDPPLMF